MIDYMTLEFEYEVEALGQSVTVIVKATQGSFPGDPGPDGEGEIEIEGVFLNGWEVDTVGIKVCKLKKIWPLLGPMRLIPEWFTLTELLREAAFEHAERKAT